jgi:hypothetical protein
MLDLMPACLFGPIQHALMSVKTIPQRLHSCASSSTWDLHVRLAAERRFTPG